MHTEIYAEIDSICKLFSRKFPFGIYDEDDIYQEAFIFCLEALPQWEPSEGKLRTYLFSVLYSRLINLKRNKYFRAETPCRTCPFRAKPCEVYTSLDDCPIYGDYIRRNTMKRSLSSSIEISPSHPAPPEDILDVPKHLEDLVRKAISGDKLTKKEKDLLRAHYE